MERINTTVDHHLVVANELALTGIAAHGATVQAGGKLTLHGIVSGDLRVEEGAVVLLHGIVSGSVYNNGGKIDVTGVVGKAIHTTPDGTTTISPDAVVNEAHYGSSG